MNVRTNLKFMKLSSRYNLANKALNRTILHTVRFDLNLRPFYKADKIHKGSYFPLELKKITFLSTQQEA